MPKNLQVRDIPDPLHEELKHRAESAGRTLTDYVQGILERAVARPPAEELFARIRASEPVDLGCDASELIRQERREG